MALGWLAAANYLIYRPYLSEKCNQIVWKPGSEMLGFLWNVRIMNVPVLRILFFVIIVGAVFGYILYDTWGQPSRLMSIAGFFTYFAFLLVFSNNPARVKWRPVLIGFLAQFVLALVPVPQVAGKEVFKFLAEKIAAFLDYTKYGTHFVYGYLAEPNDVLKELGALPVFFFTVLQVVIYFGAIVGVLYHFGVLQFVLIKMATLMQLTLGTTATESLNSVAAIFLGQSEAPLLIRPYLIKMTPSELHAIMTEGFACIAGSLFASYIQFGGILHDLGMAPDSCHSKQYIHTLNLHTRASEESNAVEAISNGAVNTLFIVSAIAANLVVFLALLHLLDDVIDWMGKMLGYSGWSFERILGYCFFPLAFLMGASDLENWDDRITETMRVAELMGTKTVLNEFIAYQKLGVLVACGKLSARAQMIATYSLCGFANISSIGIQMGTLGPLCPERKSTFASLAGRALIAGALTNFMTACVAGVLVTEPIVCTPHHVTPDMCKGL